MDKISISHGLSDHDIVIAETNARPARRKQTHRNISLYTKADWAESVYERPQLRYSTFTCYH